MNRIVVSLVYFGLLVFALGAAEPEQMVRLAQQAMAAGRYPEAAGIYAELLRQLPENAGLRSNYALALHSSGRYSDAIIQLERVVREAPGATNAWLILGLAHQKLSQPELAIASFERVLKADPQNKIARLELADASLSVGRLEDAATNFEALARLSPSPPKAWQGLGVTYASLGRRAFDRLNAAAPNSPYSFALLAQYRFEQGQYRTALALNRKALESNPPIPDLHEAAAAIYRATGHADWAERELARAPAQDPASCRGADLACKFVSGQYNEVIALAALSNTPEALYWKSRAWNALSGQALRHLRALPDSAELHEVLGEAYRLKDRKEDSVREWREAVRLNPGDAYAMRGFARALWLHRDYSEAQPLIGQLLKDSPGSSDLNYQFGEILLEQQDAEQAVPYLKKAVQLAPRMNAAHGALGRALLKIGQVSEAIPHLEAALPEDTDGSLHYQLGRAWQQTGKEQKAKECFDEQKRLAELSREAASPGEITPP